MIDERNIEAALELEAANIQSGPELWDKIRTATVADSRGHQTRPNLWARLHLGRRFEVMAACLVLAGLLGLAMVRSYSADPLPAGNGQRSGDTLPPANATGTPNKGRTLTEQEALTIAKGVDNLAPWQLGFVAGYEVQFQGEVNRRPVWVATVAPDPNKTLVIDAETGEVISLQQSEPPSPPANDAVTSVVNDEIANMYYWLKIATGENVPQGIADTSFTNIMNGMISRCGKVDPASIRNGPAYDSAKHSTALNAFEKACDTLRDANTTLGAPQETPEWRTKAEAIKQELAAVAG